MNKKNYYSNIEYCVEEDEIDIIELIQTIKKRKKIIYITTTLFTLISIVYAFSKTPLYEVKSNVKIGFVKDKLLTDPMTITKTLQSIYHTDDNLFKNNELKKEGAYVEAIQNNKKIKNFIEIKTLGLNNEKALKKNQEVVKYIQKEYKAKIDQFLLDTKNNIANLEIEKDKITKLIIPNLKTKIELIKKQKIPEIRKKIEFYKNFKIKEIDEKIALYKNKLKKYNQAINRLYKQFNKADDTKIMIASIQMINYQNLILNLENQIKDLILKKNKILIETIPSLLNKEETIKLVNIKNIKDQILQEKNKIRKLNDKITTLKFNISPANVKNSEVVGGYIVKDFPVKPKKKLIVMITFITSFILSIFLIFIIEWWEINFLSKKS